MFLAQEIIRRKRDGIELEADEITAFLRGFRDGSIAEGQIAAFAMAVFFRGMTRVETTALTRAMKRSGEVLDWSDLALGGPLLDKHSTGGVGDKTSLLVAPIVAACGGFVPMIAGRALGHTGGTVDKLESIPGYRSAPAIDTFRHIVRDVGCAIIGQTANLAPADRRLYAIRDITATVESIPLITASILYKKEAAGLDGLVMDVKTGSGAFLPKAADGLDLARSIVEVAARGGLKAVALISDMSEVLGANAGNALEIAEAIDYLTGARREARLHAVTTALAAEMLLLGGLARDDAEARSRIDAALTSGTAAERFARMVAALGGPADLVERRERHLAAAPVIVALSPTRPGFVASIDVRRVGLVIVALGGGRRRAGDHIDHAVGLEAVAGIGSAVGKERPLALLHAPSREAAAEVSATLAEAFAIA
ncbi:MAG TPA: thymidine phosphorylase, partial [Stellaceae bacterium]|nr:thymidine phosphorylase [Stellaceae bacterium]